MKRQRTHRYPRTARLNELVREILAGELERMDDDRLTLVTVTGVDVDHDLQRATVWFDALDEATDDVVAVALGEYRAQLQRAVGRQAKIKRTPVLTFRPDMAIRTAQRIESVLREVSPELAARPTTVVDESLYRQPREVVTADDGTDDQLNDGTADELDER
jgi:ribosome-binding factor A